MDDQPTNLHSNGALCDVTAPVSNETHQAYVRTLERMPVKFRYSLVRLTCTFKSTMEFKLLIA